MRASRSFIHVITQPRPKTPRKHTFVKSSRSIAKQIDAARQRLSMHKKPDAGQVTYDRCSTEIRLRPPRFLRLDPSGKSPAYVHRRRNQPVTETPPALLRRSRS